MFCDNCKINRLMRDFINNQKFCYHCMYRIKLQKKGATRTRKNPVCRICGKEIVIKENVKKRQRSVFCSSECANQGHKNQLNNHWTRRIRKESSLRW
jgi:hypothetical protein